MKNLLITLVLALIVVAVPAGRVYAQETPGAAATLAYRFPLTAGDNRVEKLRAFLASYNSPLVGEAQTFIAEAEKNNLDWKLVAAIAGVESTFGRQIPPGSYNAWGWGIPTGAQSGIGFKDWAEGIATVSEGLATRYYGRGAQTIYEVGWIYAANGNSWGNHVRYFIDKIDTFVPTTPELLTVSI